MCLFVVVVLERLGYPFHMSACDFWLWGFFKEKVYKPLSISMAQLKQRIT
jgi:hypothetical protein